MVPPPILPPLAVSAPPPKPPTAICIQPLGRLDVRSTKVVPTEATLRAQADAPQTRLSLPPSVILALPLLADQAAKPAQSAWRLTSTGEHSDGEFDASQLDSPHSRRRLAQAGVHDVERTPYLGGLKS